MFRKRYFFFNLSEKIGVNIKKKEVIVIQMVNLVL